MPSMSPTRARRAPVAALTVAAGPWRSRRPRSATRSSARRWSSPGTLQVFTLSVPDRARGPRDDVDRADRPEGLRDRLLRARARVEAEGLLDRQRRDARSSTRSRGPAARCPTEEDAVFQFNATASDDADLHVPGAPDLRRRGGRRLDRRRGVGHARAAVEAKASLGGDGSSTIAIVALIAGTLGILLGAARDPRRPRGAADHMTGRARRALVAAVLAAAALHRRRARRARGPTRRCWPRRPRRSASRRTRPTTSR